METSLDKQCTGHPHAENMKLYAEDTMTTNEPWKLWEVNRHGKWQPLSKNPEWGTDRLYRRKPRTININGFEVPEPLRDAPSDGETCYIVNLTENRVYCVILCGTFSLCQQWLKSGIIHRTKEAAEIHLKALLSFTQQP